MGVWGCTWTFNLTNLNLDFIQKNYNLYNRYSESYVSGCWALPRFAFLLIASDVVTFASLGRDLRYVPGLVCT